MSFAIPMAMSAGMGLLGQMFNQGDGDDAAGAASQQERMAIERALGLLSPFQKAGVGAIGGLQGMLGEDPTDVINRIQGQFRGSPAFDFQKQQAQGALQNQLAAAGLGGSGAAIQKSGQLASNLAGQGQQQFLQNVLGQRQQRMGGLESLFQGGLGAAGTEAGLLGQEGQALGGLAGAGILGQQQGQANMFGGLGSLAGLFGGGGGGGMGGMGGLASLFGGGGGGASPWINPDTGMASSAGDFAPGLGF